MIWLEYESALKRQREGIAIAKQEGKYKAACRLKLTRKPFSRLVRHGVQGRTATEAMRRVGLKPNTFYRRVKEAGI